MQDDLAFDYSYHCREQVVKRFQKKIKFWNLCATVDCKSFIVTSGCILGGFALRCG